MKRVKKSQWDRWKPVIAIPVIVVILILVIVVTDRTKKDEPVTVETAVMEESTEESMEKMTEATAKAAESQAETETEVPSESETEAITEAAETAWLKQDAVPEIVTLMETYFQARASADAETINELYGIHGVSEAELEAEKARMRNNSKYVHKFDPVTTYVGEGLQEGEWLVYTTTEIQFFSVKTAAPMIMWCYVKTDADGTYRMMDPETLSAEEKQFVEEKSYSEEVRRLASDINGRLKEALNTDEELNAVYGVLRDGSPVYEGEETEVVISMEAETTESE